MIPVDILATMIQGGRGGIGRYAVELSRALCRRADVDPTVLCLADDRALFGSCPTRVLPQMPGGAVGDLLRANLLVAPRGGVLHVPSYRRVPVHGAVVATVHDLAPLHMPEKYGWSRHQFLRRIVPVALHRCRHILTVTRHTRDDLVASLGIPAERITVAHPGIDHARFHPGDAAAALDRLHGWRPGLRPGFVLYAARIEHPGKGHLALLEAWARLAACRRDLPQLVFAGAPCEGAAVVQEEVRRLGLDIVCTGFVPEALLPDLYRACRLFVFPSRYEGFGLPPVEAMACGAAVASSRAAALAETAGPAAVLDPDHAEQMAAEISRLLDDAAGRARLSEAGRRWAAGFTWEACAETTCEVYRRVVAADAASAARAA